MQVGLFGKLPAHGDFIARGLTSATRQALDRWLTQEIGRGDLAYQGTQAILTLAGTPVTIIFVPSRDRSGREFPLAVIGPPDAQVAWCNTVKTTLSDAIQGRWDAQTTYDTLLDIHA